MAFPFAERTIDRRRCEWPFRRRHTAVVGGEDEDGLLAELELFQFLHDFPNTVVDALNHGGVDGVGLLAGTFYN